MGRYFEGDELLVLLEVDVEEAEKLNTDFQKRQEKTEVGIASRSWQVIATTRSVAIGRDPETSLFSQINAAMGEVMKEKKRRAKKG